MKKILLGVVIALGAMLASFADPVEGFWISVDENTGKATGAWEIYEKDGALYGEMRSLPGYPLDQKASACKSSYKGFPREGNPAEMTTRNTPWIYGLKKSAEGEWASGHIIDPGSGSLYKCKITFHAANGKKYKTDTLEMRGEIGMGIGRSQFWQKTDKETAYSLDDVTE